MTAKIELGKKYRTRAGADVRLYCTDARGEFPVVGHILDPRWSVDVLATWTSTGNAIQAGRVSRGDLVEVSPYADIPIDAVVVTPSGAKAHFAGVDDFNAPMVWAEGRTSYTAPDIGYARVSVPHITELQRNKS